jgi:hypothetical protein
VRLAAEGDAAISPAARDDAKFHMIKKHVAILGARRRAPIAAAAFRR